MKKSKKLNQPIPESEEKNSSKKSPPNWFYLVLIIIPILFFSLLEVGLRLYDYGLDFTQFKKITDYHPDKLYLNPDLPYKYFYNTRSVPSVLPDGFDKVKKENAFRVFVLGGSSAAGWPYVPNASFPRHLKRRLELLYPESTIEVINCGISAINTYTLRDFVPGIIEQKPDLVLIYAGHNEYYGALGAGSTVYLGSSRWLVNTYLWLYNFKTTQFLQDIFLWIYSGFGSEEESKSSQTNETLMSQMIGESLIPYESETYWDGIDQFEGNIIDILETLKDNNVSVIIGTLTTNLLDLKPFVSVKTDNHPSAEEVFDLAKSKLKEGRIDEAQKLFLQAKELDALRFRAPEKINEIIRRAGQEFNVPVVEIDSIFKSKSPNQLVGYNLTVDHLHPNIDGYRLIADSYFDIMQQSQLLPKSKPSLLPSEVVDSILKANFPFTKLDSTIAEFSIIVLTGTYPFVPKGTPNYKMLNYKMKDFIDSLTARVMNREIKWETAHSQLAEFYLSKNNIPGFQKEMDAVIAERPYYDSPYENVIVHLIDRDRLQEAIPYLLKLHSFKPGYFTNKWLGQLYLSLSNPDEAIKYLADAVKYSDADSQVWYNLAGGYYLTGNSSLSLDALKRSISLDPNNMAAQNFYRQLLDLTHGK